MKKIGNIHYYGITIMLNNINLRKKTQQFKETDRKTSCHFLKHFSLLRMKTTMHCIVEDLECSINKMEGNVAFVGIRGINIQGRISYNLK